MGVGVETFVAVLLTPFLIRRLGESAYGTWIVIGSLTGYLGILDFGLRGSVGRFVAFYDARNDRDGVLAVLNTAGVVLTGLGLVFFGITAIASQTIAHWAEVPPELLPEAQRALLIVGVNLLAFFVLRIFDATLWGYQRFDLLNQVDIPSAAFRGILSAFVVSQGFGLVGLAWVTLGLSFTVGITKAAFCIRINRELRCSIRHVRVDALREMWEFGVWNFFLSLAYMARTQLSPVVIGATLGMSWVTPFSIVMRLVGTATTLIAAGVGVLTPMATALYAQSDQERQKRLFFESGRFCTAAALYFFSLFIFLGRPLLSLWIGPHYAWAWLPLSIIAAGELFPMSVSMAYNTAHGMNRVRSLAFRGACECLTALILAWGLGLSYGFVGICAALAIAASFWRGWFTLQHALTLTNTRLFDYCRSGPARSAMAAIPPAIGLAAMVWLHPPENWLTLCAFGATFTLATAACFFGCHLVPNESIRSQFIRVLATRRP
jgi:O-antigen/teichoic acid export membrane protein